MEDDGLGNQFFLRMFGPVDAPEYAYDRDAAKQHRRDALAAEKAAARRDEDRRDDDTAGGDPPVAPQGPDSLAPQGSPAPASTDKESETEKPNEGDSPTLLNRIRRPKDKGKSNLFNPDDEDYLDAMEPLEVTMVQAQLVRCQEILDASRQEGWSPNLSTPFTTPRVHCMKAPW